MSGHLLLVTIGPVQAFIEQARRTRDLWYASHILSELARAGAKALASAGASLILPALDGGDPELEPCEGFVRENGEPPAPLAEKLLAELAQGLDPAQTLREARQAIAARWQSLADAVRGTCRLLLAEDVDQVWDEQIAKAFEFYASWAPLRGDYAATRRTLERVIAGRKLLRHFTPWAHDRPGAPKSSLDGGRVSVLAEERPKALVRKYRIGRGEQLDAVGLVKRAGGKPEQFPPLVNVAVAAWIEAACSQAPRALEQLRVCAEALNLPRVRRSDLSWTQPFPFDAEVLLASRVAPLFDELEIAGDPQLFVDRELRPLYRILGEPSPYVACLVADGDRMGKALDAIDDAAAHRAFSRALAGFAAAVRKIVEQEHRGALVYAGGDDVLAFLPVVDAVPCADALRRRFEQVAGNAAPADLEEKPTLSVGIGIGHLMAGMGELLELGRAAKRLAKTKRNALGLILDKRSGARQEWVCSWDAEPNPAALLKPAGQEGVAAKLSTKKIHEIDAILRRLPEPGSLQGGDVQAFGRVLAGEVRRALARNEPVGLSLEEAGLRLPADDYGSARKAVADWVARLLIARAIAEAEPKPHTPQESSQRIAEEAAEAAP